MRRGMSPDEACADAVRRIERFYPKFELGLVCVDTEGRVGAASHGWNFTYCAASEDVPVDPESGLPAECVHVPPMDGDAAL